jgi:hypothetical protein
MASNPFDQFDSKGNPFDQFDGASEQQAAPAEKAGPLDYVAGIPETLAHLGAGLATGPASGYAGMATMLGNKLGLTDADPADVTRSVQSLAFEPRSVGGKALTNAVTYPFRKYGELAEGAGDLTRQGVQAIGGSPEQAAGAGTAVNTGLQGIPMALGLRFGSRPAVTKAPRTPAPEVQAATNAGLKLTPRMAGGPVGKVGESLANSAKLERNVSLKNAEVVDAGVLQQVGLPPGTPVTRANLQAAKAPYNGVYQEVSKLPPVTADNALINQIKAIPDRSGMGVRFPGNVAGLKAQYIARLQDAKTQARNPQSMQTVLDEVRQLRKESAAAKRGPYDPAKIAEADVKRKIADALEAQIDRHIKSTPNVPADLFPRYKKAQQQLAVIESATKAVKGGHIDARILSKQQERGVPLSGPMKEYATAFDNFDRALQNPARLRNTGPFDALDAVIGTGAAFTHPAVLAGILGRPLVRNALASDLYQKSAIAGSSGFQIPYSVGVLPPAVEQLNHDRPPRLPAP